MTNAQSGMTALLQIHWRSTESKNQKIPKPLLGPWEIMRRIKRPQHVVTRNLPVKRRQQAFESFLTDDRIDLLLFHGVDRQRGWLEARGGIEPPNKGFADLCLTTWLPRRNCEGLS